MKALGIIIVTVVATIIAIPVLWVGGAIAYETWHTSVLPIRLTLEIDTPQGVRSAAGVIRVAYTKKADWAVIMSTGGGYVSVRGEAVFVDLGEGRNVIAILGFGPNGSEDRISDLPPLARQAAERGTSPAVLTGARLPTLVTFTDLNDPKTARVVRPDMFEQEFGPGFRFRRATLEMVPAGTWPFTWIGWPHSLAGEPVTRGIETRLPWLRPLKGYLAGPQPDLTNTRPSRNLTGNEFIKGI